MRTAATAQRAYAIGTAQSTHSSDTDSSDCDNNTGCAAPSLVSAAISSHAAVQRGSGNSTHARTLHHRHFSYQSYCHSAPPHFSFRRTAHSTSHATHATSHPTACHTSPCFPPPPSCTPLLFQQLSSPSPCLLVSVRCCAPWCCWCAAVRRWCALARTCCSTLASRRATSPTMRRLVIFLPAPASTVLRATLILATALPC